MPPEPHPAAPVFSLKLILFWLHHCPGSLVYLLLYPNLLQAADLKDQFTYYLLLLWIKGRAVFPRGICIWRFQFGEEITRELLEA